MSRIISAVLVVVFVAAAFLVFMLSCEKQGVIERIGGWALGLPDVTLCYQLLPSLAGKISGIVLVFLSGVALLATVAG